jgi:hypothetical protein
MPSVISPFEYVTVLIAIILGMGLTKVVSGLTKLVQHSEKVKIYWPHLILIFLIFIIHIQEWWELYSLLHFKWRLPVFLFLILYPVNLYVLATILFPPSFRGKVIDLKVFYYENFRRIYLFVITLDTLAIIDNLFISNFPMGQQVAQFMVLGLMLVVVIGDFKYELLHKALALLLIGIMITTLIIGWNIYII